MGLERCSRLTRRIVSVHVHYSGSASPLFFFPLQHSLKIHRQRMTAIGTVGWREDLMRWSIKWPS